MTSDPTEGLARLDRRVADAAEAWLTDPRDTGIYARLVAAVTERRHVLDALARTPLHAVPDGTPALDAAPAPAPDAVQPAAADGTTPGEREPGPEGADPEPDDDAEPAVPLRPVGADLVGDPRAVLDRLRRG